jgi:hypothetical protein
MLPRTAKSGIAVLALVASATITSPVDAADPGELIGNWKLVSWQVIAGNETQNPFGLHPKGYLILTREGRAVAITTADNRKAGSTDAERAALQKSMLAYSGKYHLEGDDFITTVDISWNENWNGTEQRRHYRIEGDRLFIETAPAPWVRLAKTQDEHDESALPPKLTVAADIRDWQFSATTRYAYLMGFFLSSTLEKAHQASIADDRNGTGQSIREAMAQHFYKRRISRRALPAAAATSSTMPAPFHDRSCRQGLSRRRRVDRRLHRLHAPVRRAPCLRRGSGFRIDH